MTTLSISEFAARRGIGPACLVAALLALTLCTPLPLAAQTSPSERLADEALAELPASAHTAAEYSVPLLELVLRGGWLMVPIALMSIIVVAIAVERLIGLRRARVLPRPLASALNEMVLRGTFEPRAANELCQHWPSSTARVVQAMLQRVGRSPGEIEQAVTEACGREADRLYTNVRTLNLATSVTPLLGLLGTVWGMIQAFFATANLPIGSNKGQALAEGIYVALVTTFAGLAVAIPAAILAHLFEARILRLLRDIEQLLGRLLPQVDQFEGKLRIDHRHRAPTVASTSTPPHSKAS